MVYKGEIDKQEAGLIKEFLYQAIARLAAPKNAPRLPTIPCEAKPLKTIANN